MQAFRKVVFALSNWMCGKNKSKSDLDQAIKPTNQLTNINFGPKRRFFRYLFFQGRKIDANSKGSASGVNVWKDNPKEVCVPVYFIGSYKRKVTVAWNSFTEEKTKSPSPFQDKSLWFTIYYRDDRFNNCILSYTDIISGNRSSHTTLWKNH